MTSSIVHGRYLITRASGHETSVLQGGAIYQRDGVIEEVGAFQELSLKHPDAPVLGGDDFLVMPGLINAHHHGKGVSPLMKGSLDDHLEYWMADSWGRKSVDMYLDTLYACMKMLRSGVTTVMFNLSPGAAAETLRRTAKKALTAFADAGMRVNFSVYVESQYRIIAEDESVFLSRLPSDLAARAKEVLDDEYISDDDYIALSESLHARAPRRRVRAGHALAGECSLVLGRASGEDESDGHGTGDGTAHPPGGERLREAHRPQDLW